MNPNDVVQPILVVDYPDNSHLEIVHRVALVSVSSYLADARSLVAMKPWNDWLSGRFTKSVRRIKPKDVEKALSAPGVKVSCGKPQPSKGCLCCDPAPQFEASVIGFEPMPYGAFSPVLKRAQVAGIDYNRRIISIAPEAPVQVVLNPAVEMSTGKTAAQAAHALFAYVLTSGEKYYPMNIPFGVSYSDDFDNLDAVVEITDAGFTEIEPGTKTAKVVLK